MFETHEVTRPASIEEMADLTGRLLEVLSGIDATKEEAKAAASDFCGILKDLHKREIGLRFNLQSGTVTQSVEVKPLINENLNIMEYFDRDGNRVNSLTRPLSSNELQYNMFEEKVDTNDEVTSDDSQQQAEEIVSVQPKTTNKKSNKYSKM